MAEMKWANIEFLLERYSRRESYMNTLIKGSSSTGDDEQ